MSLAETIMENIRPKVNETIIEKAKGYWDAIVYEVKMWATEGAWLKSRGETPAELNLTDIENAKIFEKHVGADGFVSCTVGIRDEYQETLDSGQKNGLRIIFGNARKRGAG